MTTTNVRPTITRSKMTEAERLDIKETYGTIMRQVERLKERHKILISELEKRLRTGHPESNGKFIRPDGEWLAIIEEAGKIIV